jgi:hypothetical protein
VNPALPVLAAGGVFAAATLLGLLAGFWLLRVTGQGLWVLGGLFAGVAVGAYSAFRLFLRSL